MVESKTNSQRSEALLFGLWLLFGEVSNRLSLFSFAPSLLPCCRIVLFFALGSVARKKYLTHSFFFPARKSRRSVVCKKANGGFKQLHVLSARSERGQSGLSFAWLHLFPKHDRCFFLWHPHFFPQGPGDIARFQMSSNSNFGPQQHGMPSAQMGGASRGYSGNATMGIIPGSMMGQRQMGMAANQGRNAPNLGAIGRDMGMNPARVGMGGLRPNSMNGGGLAGPMEMHSGYNPSGEILALLQKGGHGHHMGGMGQLSNGTCFFLVSFRVGVYSCPPRHARQWLHGNGERQHDGFARYSVARNGIQFPTISKQDFQKSQHRTTCTMR